MYLDVKPSKYKKARILDNPLNIEGLDEYIGSIVDVIGEVDTWKGKMYVLNVLIRDDISSGYLVLGEEHLELYEDDLISNRLKYYEIDYTDYDDIVLCSCGNPAEYNLNFGHTDVKICKRCMILLARDIIENLSEEN